MTTNMCVCVHRLLEISMPRSLLRVNKSTNCLYGSVISNTTSGRLPKMRLLRRYIGAQPVNGLLTGKL